LKPLHASRIAVLYRVLDVLPEERLGPRVRLQLQPEQERPQLREIVLDRSPRDDPLPLGVEIRGGFGSFGAIVLDHVTLVQADPKPSCPEERGVDLVVVLSHQRSVGGENYVLVFQLFPDQCPGRPVMDEDLELDSGIHVLLDLLQPVGYQG
jgi:hypothetical protein